MCLMVGMVSGGGGVWETDDNFNDLGLLRVLHTVSEGVQF